MVVLFGIGLGVTEKQLCVAEVKRRKTKEFDTRDFKTLSPKKDRGSVKESKEKRSTLFYNSLKGIKNTHWETLCDTKQSVSINVHHFRRQICKQKCPGLYRSLIWNVLPMTPAVKPTFPCTIHINSVISLTDLPFVLASGSK